MKILSYFKEVIPCIPRTASPILTAATLITGCALVIIGILMLALTKQMFPLVLCAAGGVCIGISWIKRVSSTRHAV